MVKTFNNHFDCKFSVDYENPNAQNREAIYHTNDKVILFYHVFVPLHGRFHELNSFLSFYPMNMNHLHNYSHANLKF